MRIYAELKNAEDSEGNSLLEVLLVAYETVDIIGREIDIRGNVGRIVYIIGRRLHTSRERSRPHSPFAPGRALPDTHTRTFSIIAWACHY